jgi:hypothetical protein
MDDDPILTYRVELTKSNWECLYRDTVTLIDKL